MSGKLSVKMVRGNILILTALQVKMTKNYELFQTEPNVIYTVYNRCMLG